MPPQACRTQRPRARPSGTRYRAPQTCTFPSRTACPSGTSLFGSRALASLMGPSTRSAVPATSTASIRLLPRRRLPLKRPGRRSRACLQVLDRGPRALSTLVWHPRYNRSMAVAGSTLDARCVRTAQTGLERPASKARGCGPSDGRYWARTSDLRLVEAGQDRNRSGTKGKERQ